MAPDGQRVIGVLSHRLQHWDASTGALQQEVGLQDPPEFASGGGPAASPDGRLLAVPESEFLRIIDIPSLQCSQRIFIRPNWGKRLLYTLAFLAWPVVWTVLRRHSQSIHNPPRQSWIELWGPLIFIGLIGIVYALRFLFVPSRHIWLVLHWNTARAAVLGALLLCILCLSMGITRFLISRKSVESADEKTKKLTCKGDFDE